MNLKQVTDLINSKPSIATELLNSVDNQFIKPAVEKVVAHENIAIARDRVLYSNLSDHELVDFMIQKYGPEF